MDNEIIDPSVSLVPEGDNVVGFELLRVPDDTDFHLDPDKIKDKFVYDSLCAGLQFQLEVTDVIRGKTSEGEPATLLLLRFRFFYWTTHRRLESVDVRLKFVDSKNRPVYTPEILSFWPNGNHILNEYEFKVDQKVGWTAGVSLKPPSAPIEGTVNRNWERTERDRLEVDRAWLTGGTYGEGKIRNGFRLFTAENKKSGVTPDIRAAVVLQHQDEDDMELFAEATISADAGVWFQTAWLFRGLGASRKIASTVFTPRNSPLAAGVDTSKLDKADLERLSGVPPKQVIDEEEQKQKFK